MKATPADVLNGAAELIERDGWCQHKSRLPSGERCLTGALFDAAGDDHGRNYWTARRVVVTVIGTGVVALWNDEAGRTKDEVVAALRTAAARAESAA